MFIVIIINIIMFVLISAVSNYNLVQSAGISSQSYFLLDLTQPFNGIFPLHKCNNDFSNDDNDTNDIS